MMGEGLGGGGQTMAERGFAFLPPAGADRRDTAEVAARAVHGVEGRRWELITGEREQLKLLSRRRGGGGLCRSKDELREKLPSICDCVDALEAAARGLGLQFGELNDCYCLLTRAGETGAHARAAQPMHLDDAAQFLVATLLLRGRDVTEFHDGRFSDTGAGPSGQPEGRLPQWTEDWKVEHGTEGERAKSSSIDEQQHWQRVLEAAGLADEAGWTKVLAGPAAQPGPGDGVLFWSNKAHRGPATRAEDGERLALFLSLDAATPHDPPHQSCEGAVAAAPPLKKQRKAGGGPVVVTTDYNLFKEHLLPKLQLSQRAARRQRQRGAS